MLKEKLTIKIELLKRQGNTFNNNNVLIIPPLHARIWIIIFIADLILIANLAFNIVAALYKGKRN